MKNYVYRFTYPTAPPATQPNNSPTTTPFPSAGHTHSANPSQSKFPTTRAQMLLLAYQMKSMLKNIHIHSQN